ncbi:hypothetical protein RYH70_04055 [Alloalcanivorax xenomutans]|uniref:hypothetical protein n=1 Tax=Alloalcanivorax xenomutans TaxID=1094342 RepID=UPI002934E0AA|nr:hypothetical protein [Alloalcanivorax xenomutans]WOD29237.1 hypothetical protein RYH70_04055 [Alloalcanivorax xenomutans]
MLAITEWKIFHDAEEKQALSFGYKRAFFGHNLDIDDRLKWLSLSASSASCDIEEVIYDNDSARLIFSRLGTYSINELSHIQKFSGKVLFDATSLLLPELLYLMDWAHATNQLFDVIYVEPDGYAYEHKSKVGLQGLDYSLSEDGPGLCMLPRFVFPMEDSRLVVGLGYESHRFGAMLSSDEISPQNITGVLAVPPFVLGWETNSYSKNHRIMDQARKDCDASFMSTAANDPIQNYKVLSELLQSEKALRKRPKIHLAPIGTKPAALAMAWFAINNKGVSVLYDFIKKKPKRTEGVGKVHLWEFSKD